VDRRQVWARIALVAQGYVRWPFTAGQNIAIGRHDHPSPGEAMPWAAEASGAHEVIAGLPDGYDTLLDQAFKGGQELSTGQQWQRVAVARGFYRDASLLTPPRARRRPADHIYVLDHGRITERLGLCRLVNLLCVLSNEYHCYSHKEDM
jgi:ABC-type transport system involved in Fe-S cluster assembly fused permease/ATPase subunit